MQKIWDPQGPHMGFYMGPLWAPHMGLRWDFQHGFMWYPLGQTHMGHKWEPYGSHSGFGPSGPCPVNLCRIYIWFKKVGRKTLRNRLN